MATDRGISFKLAVQGAEESIRVLSTFGDQGAAQIGKIVEKLQSTGGSFDQATKKAKEFNEEAAGGKSSNNKSYLIGNLSNQLQDFIVQYQGGTSAIRAFSQQAPQAADAFALMGGRAAALAPVIGTVIVGVTALGGALYALTGSHQSATEAAKSHADEMGKLFSALGVSTGSAEHLTASFSALSEQQKELVAANLAAQVDLDAKALNEAKAAADGYVASLAKPGLLQEAGSVIGRLFGGERDPNAKPSPGLPSTLATAGTPESLPTGGAGQEEAARQMQAQSSALEGLYKNLQMGALGYGDFVAAVQKYQATLGDSDEQQREAARNFVELADKQEVAKQAADLHRAQYDKMLESLGKTGAFTDADRAILAHAETLSRATAAAAAFAKAENDAENEANLPTNPRDRAVQKNLNSADPYHTQSVADTTKAALAFGKEFDAAKAVEDQKKLSDAIQQTSDTLKQATDSSSKYAQAGIKAADATAKQLGAELAATPEGQKAVENAKNAAVALAKHTEALQKNEQASHANEQAKQRLAGMNLVLTAGTDKVKQAELEAEAQAKQSGVTDQRLIQQLGQAAAARERQTEATSQANKANAEAQRIAEFTRKTDEDLAASERALAAAQAGGAEQTREAIAHRQAEQQVIQSGLKLRDDLYQKLVAEREQTILNNQATQERLKIAQIELDLQSKIKQGQFFGYTSEGRPILAADGGSFKTERTQTVQADELYGGRPTNIPTIYGGQQYGDREAVAKAIEFNKAGFQFPNFDNLDEALESAKKRTSDLNGEVSNLEEAFKRQAFIEAEVTSKTKDMSSADDATVAKLTKEAAAAYEVTAAHKARAAAALGSEADQRTLQQQTDLLEALGKSVQAYKDLELEQQIFEVLRQQGITPDRVGQEEFDTRVNEQKAAAAAKAVTAAEAAEKSNWNKLVTDAFVKPLEEIPDILGKSLDDFFTTLNTTGKVDFAQFGQGLMQGIQGVGQNFLGEALKIPFQVAGDQLRKSITDSLNAPGGNPFTGISDFMKQGPAQRVIGGAGIGATIGGIGGTVGTAITGNPNTGLGGSIGGLAGGIAGSYFGPVGSLVGGMLGTAAGSFIGSLFGGQQGLANNQAHLDWAATSQQPGGIYYQDRSASPENRSLVNKIADQLTEVTRIVAQTGGTFQAWNPIQLAAGDKSGLRLNGVEYGSADELLAAAIQATARGAVGANDTQNTVLQNTKAKTVGQLSEDIQFGRQYDVLTGSVGEFGKQLIDLQGQFLVAKARAAELGLATDGLDTKQAEAEQHLRAGFTLQIDTLIGRAGPFKAAMQQLDDQFKAANDNAHDLGYTTRELTLAQQQQTALIRTQFINQYNELTGQTTDYSKQLLQLNENFRQAAILGRDLGINTSNLGQLQQKAVTDLRNTFVQRFNELTTVSTGFGSSLQSLRDRFKEARDIAGQLGLSTADLAGKQAAAEKQLAQEAQDALRTQVQGAADQLRQFLTGLTTPLRNALSAFGGLAGIVSPQQQLAQGLAEFRATLARARTDDVASIQALPQQAQAVLQLAKQYDASGAGFAAIFKEVNSGLQEVLTANQQRSDSIMASIPDTLKLTAADQIRTLQDGFTKVSDQLEALRTEIRLLQPGRAA